MKKIFVMMTILLLFVLACGSNTGTDNPGTEDNGAVIPPDTDKGLGDALTDSKDQIGSTDGMTTYYASHESTDETHGGILTAVANVFINSAKTEMKQTSVYEYNGKFDPHATEEVYELNKAIMQVAMEGTLKEITGKELYKRDDKHAVTSTKVDYTGYTLYEMNIAKMKAKLPIVAPWNGDGTWIDGGTDIERYLIKEADNKLYMIYVYKDEEKYSIDFDIDLDNPDGDEAFTKK